jgi:hypothetical protein
MLHHALFARDGSETRSREVLERQATALVAATRRLDEAGDYALSGTPGRAVLLVQLDKLAKAAEAFQKTISGKESRESLQREFIAMTETWERALRGLEDLKLQESVYLLRSAGRVDRLHEVMHNLLGIKGERPRLILRT